MLYDNGPQCDLQVINQNAMQDLVSKRERAKKKLDDLDRAIQILEKNPDISELLTILRNV